MPAVVKALEQYATLIEPWAKAAAEYMIADVSRRNAIAWKKHSEDMGKALRAELQYAPTGHVFQRLLGEQVNLIKSLPLDAAKRVHELTTTGLIESRRAESIKNDILATGHVTESRARLIARTEVARTAANLTQARAEFVGSEGYIWRTSGDFDVRPSHQEMEGKYVRWDTKPHLSDGTVTHAGCIYNCRCWPEPVLPDF